MKRVILWRSVMRCTKMEEYPSQAVHQRSSDDTMFIEETLYLHSGPCAALTVKYAMQYIS